MMRSIGLLIRVILFELEQRVFSSIWSIGCIHAARRQLGATVNGHRSFPDCGLRIFPSRRVKGEPVISR